MIKQSQFSTPNIFIKFITKDGKQIMYRNTVAELYDNDPRFVDFSLFYDAQLHRVKVLSHVIEPTGITAIVEKMKK